MTLPIHLQEKNDEDFEAITSSIRSSLEKMKRDRSIPATQEALSKMAGCSRKTLHNRIWPITQLKAIKDERATGLQPPRKSSQKDRVSVQAHITREQLLIERVETLQIENARFFDNVQELELQLKGAKEAQRVLEDERGLLLDEVHLLRANARHSIKLVQ